MFHYVSLEQNGVISSATYLTYSFYSKK